MYIINRSITIIKLKQPFFDWANQLPDAERKVSLDNFKRDCLAISIPKYNTDEEAKEYSNEIKKIFLKGNFLDGSPKSHGGR